MASPSDTPQPPKKPTPPTGKPAGSPPQKPQAAGKQPPPGAKPAQAKPASGKGGDGKGGDGKDGKGPETKKPSGVKKGAPNAKPMPAREAAHGSGRRFGQVLIDLGFIDEDQLWDILEEAKNTGQLTGQTAVARGLLNEDQLLTALADQQGLKVVNLEDIKVTPEAATLVPETMASVYKVLPLTYRDNVLTIALSEPSNLAALDDLRSFLGVKEVVAMVASQKAIAEASTKAYAGKEESIIDIIKELESDADLGPRRNETSIDLESLMEIQDALPVRRHALRNGAAAAPPGHGYCQPYQSDVQPRYRRAPPAARRPHRA